jgi:hypothetical protein
METPGPVPGVFVEALKASAGKNKEKANSHDA